MKRISIVILVLGACLALAARVQAQQAHTYVRINVPGAGSSKGQGTIPFGIIEDGSILGWYIDSSNVNHGFLRNPKNRHITKINYPGSQSTYPQGLNSARAIVGTYVDTGGVYHGFLHSPSGNYTKFDCPGAGTGSGQGTEAGDINAMGEIAGASIDSNGTYHAFLRTKGTYKVFDAPGAGTGSGQGTFTAAFSGLTDAGAVAGTYIDSNGKNHGFLRLPDGAYPPFADPTGSVNTQVVGLSSNNPVKNDVAGIYFDSSGFFHGFLRRTTDGKIFPFDAKNSVKTGANNIDPTGTITGVYYDSSGVMHGFVRAPGPHGHITEFDVPGAGTGSGQGTSAGSSNSSGTITGNYVDSNGVNHGFVGK